MKSFVGSQVYIRLSEFVFRCHKNDVDYNIARTLLDKISEFPEVTITEISYLSNTTPASVSRFCKKIGYQSFFELKSDCQHSYEHSILANFPDSTTIETQKMNFSHYSQELDQLILAHIDSVQLAEIAQCCYQARNVAIVSDMYSFSAANLFRELLSQRGISVVTINREAHEEVLEDIFKNYEVVFLISLTLAWVRKHKALIDRYQSGTKILLTHHEPTPDIPIFTYEVSFATFDFIFSSVYYSQRIITLWITLLGISMEEHL